jgi:hypothetical protein
VFIFIERYRRRRFLHATMKMCNVHAASMHLFVVPLLLCKGLCSMLATCCCLILFAVQATCKGPMRSATQFAGFKCHFNSSDILPAACHLLLHHTSFCAGRLLRANAQRNPLFGFLRKWAIRTLLRLPAFTNKMISALAGDGISYSHCSLAASAPAAPAAGHAAAPMLKPLTAVQKQMWGCCKPGAAFPDVSIAVDGVEQSAAVLLQSKPGCFGTLVLLPDAQQEQQQGGAAEGDSNVQKENAAWPNSWGHWPLNVVQVQQQQQQQAGGGAGVVDAWGLLAAAIGGKRACDVGVLVRPDGMVAVVGAPAEVQGWLAKHVAAHTCKLDGRGGVDAAAHACT